MNSICASVPPPLPKRNMSCCPQKPFSSPSLVHAPAGTHPSLFPITHCMTTHPPFNRSSMSAFYKINAFTLLSHDHAVMRSPAASGLRRQGLRLGLPSTLSSQLHPHSPPPGPQLISDLLKKPSQTPQSPASFFPPQTLNSWCSKSIFLTGWPADNTASSRWLVVSLH